MKRRIKAFLLAILIGICVVMTDTICYAETYGEKPKETELYAKAAVLMDGDSGRVLYSKNGTNALANASTTKILTCILALEYSQPDAVLTASARASASPKVHLGMTAGEKFYMQDMLYALMLESFNDCAVVIAEHIAGSVEDFAALMNQKAKEIGCQDTYFITPNGLDGTDKNGFHHTTAADLALLMRYCTMQSEKKEEFREITAARTYSFCEISSGRSYTVTNKNAFLDMMQGAFSGKTGFTGNAGYCYVGALERDGRTYIVALLACGWPNNKTYKWSDSRKLMQYGLDNFEKVCLNDLEIELAKAGSVLVKNGQGKDIGEAVYAELEIGMVKGMDAVLTEKKEEIKVTYRIREEWEAPLEERTYVGSIIVSIEDEVLREYRIQTKEAVEKIDLKWCVKMIFKYFLNGEIVQKS